MQRILLPLAAAAVLAAGAVPAAAQRPTPTGPSPDEQVGIHVGDNNTNGSAVIVRDRNGVHPEGYPGMAIRNRASGGSASTMHHRHHHHRHHDSDEPTR